MLIGRARELESIEGMLDGAASGSGGLRVLCGEAGIGKTRLADEASAVAGRRGFAVAWGRAWETGGAPAYWPWTEVLRALAIDEVDIPDRVAALLGRDRRTPVGDGARADPARERFELFEAVASYVRARARVDPLLLVLDDLHAADVASLELLVFVARGLKTSRLAIVATQRDVEARLAPVADALLRVAREGEVLELGPLSNEDVAEIVRQDVGRFDAPLAATLHQITEGNPLFLREALRAIGASRAAPLEALRDASALGGVLGLVRGRLAGADEAVRATLELAAVCGRRFSASLLGAVLDESLPAVLSRLETGGARGLLARRSDDDWSFSHVLVREAFYRELPAVRRTALHDSLAAVLSKQVARGSEESLATWAHHALQALPIGDAGEAARVARRAADRARSQLAFEEAIALLERATGAAERYGIDARERTELALALGWALTEGGRLREGRETFHRATDLARTLGDARLLARAALGQGGAYVFAERRSDLVSVLREALGALGSASEIEDRRLYARVLARLAAALTPSATPEEPLALADEALRIVENEDDVRVRMDVGLAAGSALQDFAHPAVRVPVAERLLADARLAGDRVLRLRALTRLACDRMELGDFGAADAAIAARATLADSLGHPRYRWQTPLLRSMRAMPDGRFDDCESEIADARALAAEAQDPNGDGCIETHRLWMLLVAGRTAELPVQGERAVRAYEVASLGPIDSFVSIVVAARVGERERAAKAIASLRPSPNTKLRMTRVNLAEAALACGALDMASSLYASFAADEDVYACCGPSAFVCAPPIASMLGAVAFATGRPQEAERHMQRALALTDRTQSPAHRAWVKLAWGEALRGTRQGRERLLQALELASELQMPEVEARASAALGQQVRQPARPHTPVFSLKRDGGAWVLEHAGSVFRIKDVRGLGMLATLIERPGTEVHALDLASATGEVVDAGDAGEVVDARAREAYKTRIAELRADLDEAERSADTGRAERLRYELDALTDAIASALGLGGRERRVGSAAERARITVQRRVREAIKKIADQDAELGRHLDWTVRTGTFCAYEPDGRARGH
jgi:tetratricopeptide (TPR) repeat protein